MESPTPPTPRSMSDEELNAEVMRLQSQPDGLMAAMALIEAQNILRQQDATAYAQWQLQAQMEAASAPLQIQEPESIAEAPVAQELVSEQPQELPSPVAIEVSQAASDAPQKPGWTKESEVEDIVAALNRNYAQAATEEPVLLEEQESPLEPQSDLIMDAPVAQIEPLPIASVPPVSSDSGTPAEQEDQLVEQQQASVSRTKTSAAFSWSWISIAASPLVLVLAAFLKESGASFAQSLIVISGLIVTTSVLAGVGAVAAKRGSSPMGVISRAAFGVWGNVFPGVLMLLIKIVWSVALIIFGARILTPLISSQPWFAPLSMQFVFPAEFTAFVLTVVPMVLIASLVAGFGGITMLRSQQVSAVFSILGVGAIGFFAFSSNSILDLQPGEMLGAPALFDLAILSFCLFGFTVFSQSGDFARKLPVETPGAKVFFLSFVSTLFIPLAVGVTGVLWVFMAEDGFGVLLTSQLLPSIGSVAPLWIFVIFVIAVGLSILYLVSSSIYSLAGSLVSIGAKLPGALSVLLFSIVLLAGALTSSMLLGTSSLLVLLIELLTLSAVVAASFTGVVFADALIRSRDYHEVSLAREYGFYGRFNFTNTLGFILSTALGFGYINGSGTLTYWAGYLGDFTPEIFDVTGSFIGIAMAFGLAMLFPVLFGIPRIKSQEVKLVELDERREELKEYLATAN